MIEKFFIYGAYYGTQVVILLFLLWLALQIVAFALKHLGGSPKDRSGGSLAGTGRTRIGPRD